MKSLQHLQSISTQDEYGTPVGLLRKALFDYDVLPYLDVCATIQNRKFQNYFSKEQDALKQDWDVDFFMNPPYSKAYDFMKKAYSEHQKNNVNGLILVYSKTDTRWWHEFVENKAEVHFIQGRIKFIKDGLLTKNSSPYPSCWIIYRRS